MNKQTSSTLISGTGKKLTVLSPLLKNKYRLSLLGDYHFTLDDERGLPYTSYSARMAQWTNTDVKRLENWFEDACKEGSRAILLLGDMLSFPSEKGVDVLASLIKNSPIPVHFIAGNHDWHYEGVPGSDMAQRKEWIPKRLLPLYNGNDPMNYAVEIDGLKILMVDNSTYELTASQLAFLRKELADKKPAILGCHIPFYLFLPSHSSVNFGCGNPSWGAATDPYWEIERRERWKEEGLSKETFAFHKEMFSAENMLGTVAGHTHKYSLDVFQNKFQLVVPSKECYTLELGPAFFPTLPEVE